jgi:hypothetical protein
MPRDTKDMRLIGAELRSPELFHLFTHMLYLKYLKYLKYLIISVSFDRLAGAMVRDMSPEHLPISIPARHWPLHIAVFHRA